MVIWEIPVTSLRGERAVGASRFAGKYGIDIKVRKLFACRRAQKAVAPGLQGIAALRWPQPLD